MTKEVFYRKVGKTYEPIAEYDDNFINAMRKGNTLVMCYPGGTTKRFNVDPAFAPMIAAGRFAEDVIAKHISDASAIRMGKQTVCTDEQLAAWKALENSLGEGRCVLEWPSAREAACKAVTAMAYEADRMLSNPAVKKAWDNFMLICELTKTHEDQQV